MALWRPVTVPAYSLKEAGKSLRRGEEIFYMGWLMAGTPVLSASIWAYRWVCPVWDV